MRIAILDTYSPIVDYKDQGQIIGGLKDMGVDSFFISINDFNLDIRTSPFSVVTGDLMDINFWKNVDADTILFFSRLDPKYTRILKKIKESGKRIIVKADSDGTIGYPLVPNYLRILKFKNVPIRWIFSNVKWRLPVGYFVKRKLKHIELADAIIFETPEAFKNAEKVLNFWKLGKLVNKLFFVPNPVSPDIIDARLGEKEDIIISVGRWDDEGCKNTSIMLKVGVDFLKINKGYRHIIVGQGEEIVFSLMKNLLPEISSRITVLGCVSHEEMAGLFSKSKIFFAPSNLESFNISAAEALCMGCSVVGTPLENFRYLTAEGFSGLVTKGFDQFSCLDALICDSKKWDNDSYSSERIALFWRRRLDRVEISKSLMVIFRNN